MYARVSRIKGNQGRIDESVREYRELTVPTAERMKGFMGAYLLADRGNGQLMGITMWNTEKDMQESEAEANRLRAKAATTAGARDAPVVERYEVVYQPARIPV